MSDAEDESLAPTVASFGSGAHSAPHASVPETLVSSARLPVDPDQELGVTVGDARYEVEATIGEGGMGEVRLCRDLHVGREIAMKVIHATHRGDAEVRARFLREARVQGQLEHPAIVPVYDIGRTGDDVDYFAMRRIRGETLADAIDRLAAGDEAAREEHARHKLLAAFVRVCLAVDYAHSRGVVHRDLKPGNIMLGRFGEVYVLDWGIAKLDVAETEPRSAAGGAHVVEAQIDLQAEGTASGAILGTPGYMAPEQVLASDAVDGRADIYALGTILFEILALEPLVQGKTASDRIVSTLKGVDARPSERKVADVPPELDAICAMATAREPAHRFGSARALADAVDQFLSGDRDLAMRRDLAEKHVADAREHMDDQTPARASRTRALRELGRALALAPDHVEAKSMLVALLTAPPAEPPDEVSRDLRRAETARLKRVLPWAAAAYLSVWALLLPAAFALGVRRPWMLLAPFAAWALTAGFAYAMSRSERLLRSETPWTTLLAMGAASTTSLLFGPFVVAPIVVCANAMGNVLTGDRSSRAASPWAATLAIVVPIVLSWAGLHPVRTEFDGTSMHVVGAPLALPQHGTYALLLLSHVALLFGTLFFARRFRAVLDAAELRGRVHAWQLEQLAPRGARPSPSLPPAAPA
ncbi:MAG: serine/threonine-protein kinase [Polyangiaceae bacterium]